MDRAQGTTAEMASSAPPPTSDSAISMTPRQVCLETGASIKMVRRLIHSGDLRSRTIGGRVFVDPVSVREIFGFAAEAPQPQSDSRRVREMAARIQAGKM